jgi:hypothetical protein
MNAFTHVYSAIYLLYALTAFISTLTFSKFNHAYKYIYYKPMDIIYGKLVLVLSIVLLVLVYKTVRNDLNNKNE